MHAHHFYYQLKNKKLEWLEFELEHVKIKLDCCLNSPVLINIGHFDLFCCWLKNKHHKHIISNKKWFNAISHTLHVIR